MDMLERVADVLGNFKKVTVLMSSQSTVCASLVKPLLQRLMTAAKHMEGEATTLHQAKACLHYDLEKR